MYVEWFCACNSWFLIRGGLSVEGSLKGGTTVQAGSEGCVNLIVQGRIKLDLFPFFACSLTLPQCGSVRSQAAGPSQIALHNMRL